MAAVEEDGESTSGVQGGDEDLVKLIRRNRKSEYLSL